MKMYRCPQCHATETTPVEGTHERRCAYCSAQFIQSTSEDGPKTNGRGGKLTIATALTLVLAGIGLWLVLPAKKSVPRAPAAASVTAAAPQISAVSQTTTAKPPKELAKPEKLSATFEFHSSHVNSIGGQWFYGMVTNTSSVPIAKPEVLLVLRDKENKEIATANGYAAHSLAPGELAPIRIIQEETTPFDSITAEVHARKLSYETPAQDLTVREHTETRGKYNALTFSGKVENKGSSEARFCQVFVLLFDEDDKLMDLISGYVKGQSIPANGTARFLLKHHRGAKAKAIGRIEYKVVGRSGS